MKEVKNNWFDMISLRLNGIKPYKFRIAKYILFTISAIYTILLLQAQSYELYTKGLNALSGCVLEFLKYEAPVVAVVGTFANKKVHWAVRIFAILIAIPCFYYSLKATEGFQILEYNRNKNNGIEFYEPYKQLKRQLVSKESQLDTAIKNQAKSIDLDKDSNGKNNALANQYNKDISSLQKQIKSKNNELQAAINRNSKKPCPSTISKLKSEIKQLQNSLDNTYKQLQIIKPSEALAINSSVIAELNNDIDKISQKMDKMRTEYNVDGGYGVLFKTQEEFDRFIIGLALLIEICGIFCAIMDGHQEKKRITKITTVYYENDGNEKSYYNHNSSSTSIASNNQNAHVTASSNYNIANRNNTNVGYHDFDTYDNQVNKPQQSKKIGFDIDIPLSPTLNIDNQNTCQGLHAEAGKELDFNEAVLQYRIKMEETSEGITSIGYKKIAKLAGLSPTQANEVYGYLKQTGIIAVENAKTIIKKWLDA